MLNLLADGEAFGGLVGTMARGVPAAHVLETGNLFLTEKPRIVGGDRLLATVDDYEVGRIHIAAILVEPAAADAGFGRHKDELGVDAAQLAGERMGNGVVGFRAPASHFFEGVAGDVSSRLSCNGADFAVAEGPKLFKDRGAIAQEPTTRTAPGSSRLGKVVAE